MRMIDADVLCETLETWKEGFVRKQMGNEAAVIEDVISEIYFSEEIAVAKHAAHLDMDLKEV